MNNFITTWLGFVNSTNNLKLIDGDDVLSAIGAVNNLLNALNSNYATINTANPTLNATQRSTLVTNLLGNLDTLNYMFV